MNADTYRPLRAEDPPGTPCHHVDDKEEVIDRVLVHYGPDESWTRWRGVSVIHPTEKLRARVPDPWGELLEAAKEIEPSIDPKAGFRFRLAIAAVEAAKKGASDAP